MKRTRTLSLLILIIFFLFISGLKIFLSYENPAFNPLDDTYLYKTEAALQYYYAKEVAYGNKLPEIDFRAQYPEGLNLKTDLTACMEYLAGYSYRYIFNPLFNIPFHIYSIWFIAIISSFPIIVIYFLGLLTFHKLSAAWISSLFYGLSPFTFMRVIENFGKENLALNFIFLSSLGLLIAIRSVESKRKTGINLYIGLFFAILGYGLAFLSWHASRFSFIAEMLIIFILIFSKVWKREHQKVIVLWILGLMPFVLFLPVLRARFFVFSPGMFLGYTLILDYFIPRSIFKSTSIKRIIIILLIVIGYILLQQNATDSHIVTLMKDKIKYFFAKPDDPSLLSFESRIMWIEAFHSPRLEQLIYYFLFLIILSIIELKIHYHNLKKIILEDSTKSFLFLHIIVFGILFLIVYRMHSFFIFWACLAVGGGLSLQYFKKKLTKGIVLILIAIQLIYSTYQSITIKQTNLIYQELLKVFNVKTKEIINFQQNNLDLINWIKNNTNPDESFVGWIGTTPSIYCYANRPIILHSKFENNTVRNKFKEFCLSLFESEESFSEFCKKYKVKYFVYQINFLLDDSKDSLRYIAGTKRVSTELLVYLFHFKPFELNNFELVYQNPFYRIYEFLPSSDQSLKNLPIGYEPVYDKKVFNINRETFYDDSLTESTLNKINSLYYSYSDAIQQLKNGNIRDAEFTLLQIVNESSLFYRAWLRLGEIDIKKKQYPEAVRCFQRVFEGYPENPEALKFLKILSKNSPSS